MVGSNPGFRPPMYPYAALGGPYTAKIRTPITLGIRGRAKLLAFKPRSRRPCGFDSHRPLQSQCHDPRSTAHAASACTHRRLDRFDPSPSGRPARIRVRRPRWSVRKASKMRSDHLKVLICSQQGKAIFATGDRNQYVVDQRAWSIFVWHAILAK